MLKVKAAEVDKIVREAVQKGITKATEIAKIVREKLIELATDFKCEDALSASVSTEVICHRSTHLVFVTKENSVLSPEMSR